HTFPGSVVENNNHKHLSQLAEIAVAQIKSGQESFLSDPSTPWFNANDPWNLSDPELGDRWTPSERILNSVQAADQAPQDPRQDDENPPKKDPAAPGSGRRKVRK